jgi:lysophospholipase L1-like esterase
MAYDTTLLRGIAQLGGSRLPDPGAAGVTADTASTALIPAGAHLAVRTAGARLRLRYRLVARHPMAAPRDERFSIWSGGRSIGGAPADPSGTVDLVLEETTDARDVEIHLPEAHLPVLDDVEVLDGAIEPVVDRPVWIAYGDSITQGWSVSDPGRSWPAVAAAATGHEMWNLGFAGAARGEIAVALMLGSLPTADVVSLAFGTNAWSNPPTDATAISATLRLFAEAVRQEQPSARLVILSPLLRPAAERTANRFGSTLEDLRTAIEDVASDLPDSTLVRGRDLVDAARLPDGIHPDDEGARAVGSAVARAVAA